MDNSQEHSSEMPPMMELIALLRSEGFTVSTDDYVSLLKIVELFQDEGLGKLGLRIAPIIATTPDEQDRFYKVFERYQRTQERTLEPDAAGGVSKMRWVLASALLVTIGLAAFFVWQGNKLYPLSLPPKPSDTIRIAQKDPLGFDLTGGNWLKGREKDSALLRVDWEDIGQGSLGSGFQKNFKFAQQGLHLIRRSLNSERIPIENGVDTVPVYVCPQVIQLSIRQSDSNTQRGKRVTLHVKTDPDSIELNHFLWTVELASGGRKQIFTDSPVLKYQFDTAGIYELSCSSAENGYLGYSAMPGYTSINVQDTGRDYQLLFKPDDKPIVLESSLKVWPLVFSAVLAGFLIWWGFWKNRKPKDKPKPEPSSGKAPGPKSGPYEVPFSPVKAGMIGIDKSLRRFLQQLRFSTDDEALELNVKETISATIRSAGLSELVFSPRKNVQEYLVLIDDTEPKGLLAPLYQYLCDLMEIEGIPILRYRYDADFKLYHPHYPSGTTLRVLADNHPDAVPLIFGDGSVLISPLSGMLKSTLAQQISRWSYALLISPLPRSAWGMKERTLGRHFLTASADAEDLERLGQKMRTTASAYGRIPGLALSTDAADNYSLRDIRSLKSWFGNDEVLFQILCAVCIYPKPRWELLVAFAQTILECEGRASELRYDLLLQYCRIPWMALGSFPQRLRMDLLKELSEENEVAVRAKLVQLLEEVGENYKLDYVFSAEKTLQDTISGFVLYSNDPQKFAAHSAAAARFGKMYQAGEISDVPARKYLESQETGWQTPLRKDGRLTTAQSIIAERSKEEQDEKSRLARIEADARFTKRLASGIAVALLATFWCFLAFAPKAKTSNFLSGFYFFNGDQKFDLRFQVQRNFTDCGDSAKRFDFLPATLQLKDQTVPLTFDSRTQTLAASISYSLLRNKPMTMLAIGAGGNSLTTIPLTSPISGGAVSVVCVQKVIAQSVGDLPATLQEIFIGNNSQLMYWNLVRQQIYVGEKSGAFSRYSIDTVTRSSEGYRVVAHALPTYALFLIRNVADDAFEISTCTQQFRTIQDALIVSSNQCESYEKMRPYYADPNDAKIYLPVAPPDLSYRPLAPTEQLKLGQLLSSFSATVAYWGFRQSNNGAYQRNYEPYDLGKALSTINPKAAAAIRFTGAVETGRNPFDRAYILLEPGTDPISGKAAPPKANPVSDRDYLNSIKANLNFEEEGDYAIGLLQDLQNSKDPSVAAEARKMLKSLNERKKQKTEKPESQPQVEDPKQQTQQGQKKDYQKQPPPADTDSQQQGQKGGNQKQQPGEIQNQQQEKNRQIQQQQQQEQKRNYSPDTSDKYSPSKESRKQPVKKS